ncbi:MAG: hypothetical protein DRI69_05575 [Bacteroidetes bacterium]|nr:MAG: hypothetical protein DRI69_05575 [Bacteroidota bacterium]
MKLGNLDSFVLPIASMNITAGYCQSLRFNVVSDYDTSRGSLEFQYTDLKVMGMDAERKREMKLLSGLANLIVVRSNNLVGDKNYVKGPILFAREKNRGLPDYVWKSLEHGILFTLLPEGIAASIEKQPAKAKEKENAKNERALKRAARKEKKREKKGGN